MGIFKDLWDVCVLKVGFQLTKVMLVENLHKGSLVAQRQVYDGLQSPSGLKSINDGSIHVTKKMMKQVQMSSKRYDEYLKKEREQSKKEN